MPLGVALVALIGAVSLATPFLRPEYLDALVRLAVARAGARSCRSCWPLPSGSLWTGLRNRDHLRPFLATVAIFVLSFAGLGVSFYPNLVPPALTIAEAAAPDEFAAVPAGGGGGPDPDDPGLHRLFLLGVPRQGPPRRGISLMRRWLWFAGLYLARDCRYRVVALLDPFGSDLNCGVWIWLRVQSSGTSC